MNHTILMENQKRRVVFSLGMLICFAMYNVWQMGFVYYLGTSLVINGRAPIPVSMDSATPLIALGYVGAILFMILFPHYVVWAERISAIAALLSVLGLYLPLSDDLMKTLIYTQVFLCCFMIGFETFIVVNFFTEKTATGYLTIAYACSTLLVAVIQNDFRPFTFSAFRIAIVIMLIMMLCFFFCLPANAQACPVYVKKSHGLRPPKKFFAGIYIVILIGCLMTLCASTAAGEVPHGVFTTYLTNALGLVFLYFFYKYKKVHPLHTVSIFMSMSVIGFLLLYLSSRQTILTYPACVLIGLGMIPCQMQPLYGLIMMKTYPSRFVPASIIGIALLTVLLQSSLVEIFRGNPNILNLIYMVIMIILNTIYLRLEPFLLYALNRRIPQIDGAQKTEVEATASEPDMDIPVSAPATEETVPTMEDPAPVSAEDALIAQLTRREKEVLELIGLGYTNGDIAKVLFISEHTVNDHTKKIYRKLNVHSRHAAANIINKYKAGK